MATDTTTLPDTAHEARQAAEKRAALVREIQEETRQAADERLESQRASDATVGWTAQQGGYPAVATDTRQKFAVSQLPDPGVARAGGFPPLEFPDDMILTDEEAATHPHGMEPSEYATVDVREAVRERLLEEGAPAAEGNGQGVQRNPATLSDEDWEAVGARVPQPTGNAVHADDYPEGAAPGSDNLTTATGGGAELPNKSASKADWVKFASSPAGGMTAEEAEAMSRDDLAAKYHGA